MIDRNKIVVNVWRPARPDFSSLSLLEQETAAARDIYRFAATDAQATIRTYGTIADALPQHDSYKEDNPRQLLVLLIDNDSMEVFDNRNRIEHFTAHNNCIVVVPIVWTMYFRLLDEFLPINASTAGRGEYGLVDVVQRGNLLDEQLHVRASVFVAVDKWLRKISASVS